MYSYIILLCPGLSPVLIISSKILFRAFEGMHMLIIATWASLLLGNLLWTPDDMPLVMEKVVNTMYVLIERTHALQGSTPQSKELRLIQSKGVIEDPPSTYKARALEIC